MDFPFADFPLTDFIEAAERTAEAAADHAGDVGLGVEGNLAHTLLVRAFRKLFAKPISPCSKEYDALLRATLLARVRCRRQELLAALENRDPREDLRLDYRACRAAEGALGKILAATAFDADAFADLDFDEKAAAETVLKDQGAAEILNAAIRAEAPQAPRFTALMARLLLEFYYESALKHPDFLSLTEAAFRKNLAKALRNLPKLTERARQEGERAARRDHAARMIGGRLIQTFSREGAPSRLLRADCDRAVPFAGRERETAELRGWLWAEPPPGVRLYVGPGGAGKTRLFLELCAERRSRGWRAGFLDRGLGEAEGDAKVWDALAAEIGLALIVVDYAETRGKETRALLDALRRVPSPGVFVVLLERNAGPWWEETRRDRVKPLCLSNRIARAEPEAPVLLQDLAGGPEARKKEFRRALERFAEETGLSAKDAATPDLSGPDLGRALLLHAAALSALQGGAGGNAEAILTETREHEERYWGARAAAAGLNKTYGSALSGALRDAMAVATLRGGLRDEGEAVRLLKAFPLFADQPHAQVKKVADLLHGLYGARMHVEPILPDLLGEVFVDESLGPLSDADFEARMGLVFGKGIAPERLRRALEVLTRLASRLFQADAEGPGGIRAIRYVRFVLGLGQQEGDAFGRLLADVARARPDAALAARIAEEIPLQTTALRELAVEAAEQALAAAPSGPSPERARLLNNLSVRLSALGRREEALAAIQEAAELYRALALSRPDAFRPDLAASLSNLSNALSDLGRREEALAASREAADIRRALALSRPDAFRPALAASLNNLSTCLSALGRREEALAAIQEAVRTLAPSFLAHPRAFASWMGTMARNYHERCEAAGRAPDLALLAPILAKLEALRREGP